jgi:acetyl esterase/lipase
LPKRKIVYLNSMLRKPFAHFSVALFLSVFQSIGIFAQLPYTEELYATRSELDINYGSATNYAGNEVQLFVDLYKPVGDANLHRPLIVLVHGGAWIGGNRNDNDIQNLAPHFASRGFVVASISYRLGFHPSPAGGSNTFTCTAVTNEANCVYPADSNEVVRAIYRGMQDVKGAIRFMKGRAELDSVCQENVYLAGVSAGGFNSLAAAFLDVPSEKPASAYALSNAPGPSATLNYCHAFFNSTGAPINRSRPDLGSIDGTIALNGQDAKVKGVANFFGATLGNLFLSSDGAAPLLYLFHQTSDVVVNCSTAPILSDMSYNCLDPFGFLGCTHIWNMPRSSGSCTLNAWATSSLNANEVFNAIVDNGSPNCLQDPAGHSILAPSIRVDEISTFFAQRINDTENTSCQSLLNISPSAEKNLHILYSEGSLQVICAQNVIDCSSYDLSGRRIHLNESWENQTLSIPINALNKGSYFSIITFSNGEKRLIRWNV